MIEFRLYYEVLGGHTHVRMFVGKPGEVANGALLGNLTMRNEEWTVLKRALKNVPMADLKIFPEPN